MKTVVFNAVFLRRDSNPFIFKLSLWLWVTKHKSRSLLPIVSIVSIAIYAGSLLNVDAGDDGEADGVDDEEEPLDAGGHHDPVPHDDRGFALAEEGAAVSRIGHPPGPEEVPVSGVRLLLALGEVVELNNETVMSGWHLKLI